MINVLDNKQCCGCNACEQVCPTHCIDFIYDSEGFKYPIVNENKCIDCHLCEKVCPMINIGTPTEPLSSEAMIFNDTEKRIESSSGGVFTAIAEETINRGGIVFGASFTKDWNVIHTSAETIKDLKKFRGSKYVQSDTLDTFSQVKKHLKEDRWVLYSGTPCQIRGLLLYLRKPYDKLITADFICHGVPSHKVLWAYIQNEISLYSLKQEKIAENKFKDISTRQTNKSSYTVKDIRFRDKMNGWKKFCFALTLEKSSSDSKQGTEIVTLPCLKSAYMKGFGKNLFLRPSCYDCPAKNFTSGSDITLADYWRVEEQHPEMDDDKGTSLISINTKKADKYLSAISTLRRMSVDFTSAYKIQTALFHSMPMTEDRKEFWNSNWENDFINVVNKIADRKTLTQRLVLTAKFILRSLGIKKLIKIIKR